MASPAPHPDAPPSPPGVTPELRAVFEATQSLHGTLAVARALVDAGRAVDLAGLDQEAARLCAALACLPAGAMLLLRPPLEAALGELDRLERALPVP